MKILTTLVNFFKKLFGKKKRVYGWKRDKLDIRDKKFKVAPFVNVPTRIDLSSIIPTVYDQGQTGSCTGNAIAGAIEYDQIRQNKVLDFLPSRLFIYFNERMIEGTIDEDCGAAIRDGIKAVNTFGVCKETIWPYIERKFNVKPSDEAYSEAILHKTVDYARLDNTNINELKACLASGYPFVFGFQVYDSFEGEKVAKSGILYMPSPQEQCCGGHAVLCCGYSDIERAFLVRNSWSKNWGLNGHFWMPYDYMTNPALASDFWVIKTIESK